MTIPEQDDHQFESYLRQFRPHHPRPLPDKGRVWFRRWAYPAAAAVVVAAVITLVIPRLLHRPASSGQHPVSGDQVSRDQTSRDQQVSLIRLSVLANQDPAKLDSQLGQVSTTLLPDVQSGHGVLKTLSAEEKF